jgi:uncharacterized protein with GYD domain
MATFIMLTRVIPGRSNAPAALEELEHQVAERIASECPKVEWLENFAVLGPYDYVDIFKAPDIDSATKVSAIVRTFGHAYTEIWPATEWSRFKEIVHDLQAA